MIIYLCHTNFVLPTFCTTNTHEQKHNSESRWSMARAPSDPNFLGLFVPLVLAATGRECKGPGDRNNFAEYSGIIIHRLGHYITDIRGWVQTMH